MVRIIVYIVFRVRMRSHYQNNSEWGQMDIFPKPERTLGQWLLTWVRSNPRGSLSQSQGFGRGQEFSTIPFFEIHVLLLLFFEHSDFVCN